MLMTTSTISSRFSVLMERGNNADDLKKLSFTGLGMFIQRHYIVLFFNSAAAVTAANLPFQLDKMPSMGPDYSLASTDVSLLHPFSDFRIRVTLLCARTNQKGEQ